MKGQRNAKVTPEKRNSRNIWEKDLKSLLDLSKNGASILYSMLIKYTGHIIFEQLLENPDKTRFEINIAPIGVAELVIEKTSKNSYKFALENIKFEPTFTTSIINTIECKQSGLLSMESLEQYRNIVSSLEEFRDGRV